MPRRTPGTLLPLETDVLDTALALSRSGQRFFHGFALAQSLRERDGARSLTAHGTLYKALGRLEGFGLLTSQWEDAAAVDGRPRRRLYELSPAGARAAASVRSVPAERSAATRHRSIRDPA
jgi:PadR family transcriptional regulator PadR